MRLSVRNVAVALEKFSHPNPDSPYHSTPSSVHRKANPVDTPSPKPISVHRKANPVDKRGCSAEISLKQLLLADGSDKFLKIERLEVGYILEVSGAVGGKGWGQH